MRLFGVIQEEEYQKKDFPKKHDIILRYSKSEKYIFNKDDVRVEYDSNYKGTSFKEKGSRAAGKEYKRNEKGKIVEDWWKNMPRPYGKEHKGYPTQKPLALLERIIKASSNEGDMVLDPFCGCATSLIAAERLNRKWIGIDLGKRAAELVTSRMRKESDLFKNFKPIYRTDIPKGHDVTRYNHPDNKKDLFGEQQGVCNGCLVSFPYRNMTIDHKVPQSKGGGDNIENLQLLCGACNSTKGKGTQEELLVKLKKNKINF